MAIGLSGGVWVVGVDDQGYLFVQSLHRRFRRGQSK